MPLTDSPYTPPTLRTLVLATLFACATTMAGCRDASGPAAVPAQASASASASVPTASAAAVASASAPTKAQAMDALMALPELKSWSAQLEKASGGKVHGALIEYDSAPKIINGKRYWQFSFVENGSDAAHRWESFFVSQTDGEILVDDSVTDTSLTLAQWRKDSKPMQRAVAAP